MPQDLVGKKFGKWIVLKKVNIDKKYRYWICRCKCGVEKPVRHDALKSGESSGCRGCHRWQGFGEISKTKFSTIKDNAKLRKLKFNLTIEYLWELYLKQERKCALSGREIVFARCMATQPKLQTASLDRIDSSKGYVKGNVQWVHKDVNFMKQEYSQDYFLEICKDIVKTKC